MAVTGLIYGKMFLAAFNEEINWDADDIYCMLTTSSYTPDQDTHDYKDDVNNEVVGTGYTAGGVDMNNPSITYTGATNKLKLDDDNASWAASTITARYAVVYDYSSGGGDSTRALICYQNFGQDESSNNGTFTVAWHADGIVEITVS